VTGSRSVVHGVSQSPDPCESHPHQHPIKTWGCRHCVVMTGMFKGELFAVALTKGSRCGAFANHLEKRSKFNYLHMLHRLPAQVCLPEYLHQA
jgi:hypothetical protein